MKISKTILSMCLGVLFLLGSSAAQAVVLTFEGLQDNEPINNYYNGGTGGFGSGPGPNYGINFTSDSLALISTAGGGTGNFSGNPSGDTIMYFLTGADTMNVAAGFTTGFSFFYACQVGFTGSVDVYSGLNGTGSLLGTLSLPPTPNPYNVWVPIGVTFGGTAESVIFGGAANFIGFDDVTLGSATPGVPDSGSTIMLLGMAFAGIAALKRKLA
jgi:VPDSG-CTERM motif